MRILIVLTFYRPHWTGLTKYAARLAEGLAKRGDQLEILCSQHQKDLAQNEIIKNVKIIRVPYQFHFLRSVIMLKFPFLLYQRIKNNDFVLAFLPLQEIVLVAILAKMLKKKLFLVHNGDLVLPEKGGFFNRLVEKIYYLTTSFGIKNSNGIVIHTKDYAENSPHLSQFKDKWRVLLPPFMIPTVSQKQVKDFIKKYKLERKKLIGFSGRFVEEKGVDYLLQAIPLVIKKIPNAHFVFAGQHKVAYENFWEKLEPLIRKYRKNITLLGLLNEKEAFIFYKSLAVLVMPSRTDCFPFAQVEAMLLGTPTVCTNIPGARWVAKKTGAGLLVEPKNPQALANGIVKAINEKGKYIKKIEDVKKTFNYQQSLDRYEELFKNN